MPRGDKSAYTDKQKRMAEHIEDSYGSRGVPEEEAERRAWATVNKETGGGKKSGSGRGKPMNKAPARKGGERGGAASAARPASARSASAKKAAASRTPEERSASARKAAATRKRNAARKSA
ncbi:plasmid stabilization protein [Roseomonas indoligenes]|uniref:Plasmid stabilization protein n=1 Tax=Roseomonas indoligenes TaxID=2820811 RepID=A0A940S6R8_9PROT|nr:plasmid stabilization protein [Pararoseomonas indoligenes]MBP0495821.1 plasmid stabilization protein [Pararoseomonas indoligenes]